MNNLRMLKPAMALIGVLAIAPIASADPINGIVNGTANVVGATAKGTAHVVDGTARATGHAVSGTWNGTKHAVHSMTTPKRPVHHHRHRWHRW